MNDYVNPGHNSRVMSEKKKKTYVADFTPLANVYETLSKRHTTLEKEGTLHPKLSALVEHVSTVIAEHPESKVSAQAFPILSSVLIACCAALCFS